MSNERLGSHLEDRYGIRVTATTELDAGVFRVDRDEGPSWVARVFPASRPLAGIEEDAAILRALERGGFPAERCAHPEPVSIHERQGVLVTGFVEKAEPLRTARTYAILGALLGRLHARPGTQLREGGAWHHLSFVGGPRAEIDAAAALLEEALPRVGVRELALHDRLRDQVERTDDCDDLPHAFVHADFVPANAIPTAENRLVIVDWAGAGRGPRLWSLGYLLWTAGATSPRLIDPVVSRYRRHVELEPDELARLPGAIRARPLMLECWAFCFGRRELMHAVERVSEANELAEAIAAQARHAFES
jgi:Ser/Thr protein kinase RdoA (MazF antagonist)